MHVDYMLSVRSKRVFVMKRLRHTAVTQATMQGHYYRYLLCYAVWNYL